MGDFHPDEPKEFGRRIYNADDARRERRLRMVVRGGWLGGACVVLVLVWLIGYR